MHSDSLLSLLAKGGLLMWPIGLCSVIALAVILERFWSLNVNKVVPARLVPAIWESIKNQGFPGQDQLIQLRGDSPLGRILAAGLANAKGGRALMKESMESTATHEVHALQKYLNVLGTIAGISPLLGLLGTVLGMIHVFSAIVLTGSNTPEVLAGGIAEALICTAAGLCVAIPALFFHRVLLGRVEMLTVLMEQESLRLVDVIQNARKEGGLS